MSALGKSTSGCRPCRWRSGGRRHPRRIARRGRWPARRRHRTRRRLGGLPAGASMAQLTARRNNRRSCRAAWQAVATTSSRSKRVGSGYHSEPERRMFRRACWVGVGALPRLTYRPFAAPSCLRSRSLNPTSLPTKAPYQAAAKCRRIRARAGSVLTTSTRSTPRHHDRSCRATAGIVPARSTSALHVSPPLGAPNARMQGSGGAVAMLVRARDRVRAASALPARTRGRWRAQSSPILRRNMR